MHCQRRTDGQPGKSRAAPALAAAALVTLTVFAAPAAADHAGGDEAPVRANELDVADGFRVRSLADGLTFPTSIEWDDDGNTYVATSGFTYGLENATPAQVLRVEEDGSTTVVADGFDPPLNDITWHDGKMYVSHRGAISVLDPADAWSMDTLVEGLPSFGDHHNNEIVFDADGHLYFVQGTTTNSGVVGLDNFMPGMGWTRNVTEGSDVPCEDVRLRGVNYVTDNPFRGKVAPHEGPAPSIAYEREEDVPADARGVDGANVTTGAYVPFGTPTFEGQVIEGREPCNGAVLVMNPDGSDLGWFAWGLRNPFGIGWDADGHLWVANNGYDHRGSRPVAEADDHFVRVEHGGWYGWPDFEGSARVDQEKFAVDGEVPELLLAEHPMTPPEPLRVGHHSAATKFDFAPDDAWGGEDTVYLAQFGDMTPMTGEAKTHSGMAVVRFTTDEAHGGGDHGNASGAHHAPHDVVLADEERFSGRFRPVEAVFGPDGNLYVVHIGTFVVVMKDGEPQAVPHADTGAVFVVEPEDAAAPPGHGTCGHADVHAHASEGATCPMTQVTETGVHPAREAVMHARATGMAMRDGVPWKT